MIWPSWRFLVEEKLEKKKQADSKILLNADKECEYGKVIDVMNEIRNANIEIVGLVTEKSSSD
jgi:biopolymer transport protein ExbD